MARGRQLWLGLLIVSQIDVHTIATIDCRERESTTTTHIEQLLTSWPWFLPVQTFKAKAARFCHIICRCRYYPSLIQTRIYVVQQHRQSCIIRGVCIHNTDTRQTVSWEDGLQTSWPHCFVVLAVSGCLLTKKKKKKRCLTLTWKHQVSWYMHQVSWYMHCSCTAVQSTG